MKHAQDFCSTEATKNELRNITQSEWYGFAGAEVDETTPPKIVVFTKDHPIHLALRSQMLNNSSLLINHVDKEAAAKSLMDLNMNDVEITIIVDGNGIGIDAEVVVSSFIATITTQFEEGVSIVKGWLESPDTANFPTMELC